MIPTEQRYKNMHVLISYIVFFYLHVYKKSQQLTFDCDTIKCRYMLEFQLLFFFILVYLQLDVLNNPVFEPDEFSREQK